MFHNVTLNMKADIVQHARRLARLRLRAELARRRSERLLAPEQRDPHLLIVLPAPRAPRAQRSRRATHVGRGQGDLARAGDVAHIEHEGAKMVA